MQELRTTLLDAGQGISEEIRECWIRLRNQNPAIESPYFTPQFVEIVAASGGGRVEVAVMQRGQDVVAIFPFERSRWNIAGPVGSFVSDYDGIICRPDFNFEPEELLRSCGLVAWDFSHLPESFAPLVPFHRKQQRSPIIDLSEGYETYAAKQREAGTEQIKKADNLMRRLEREVGPLRVVSHSSDEMLLQKLFAWKTEQFRRNRWRDLFSIPWVRRTMLGIHGTQTPEFSGMLSTLYAGDELIALHFGMRSATVWHYWFPAYEQAYAKYSPGVILLLAMAKAAPALGIKIIDMGAGEHSYKNRLMNRFMPTASGSVELNSPVTVARRIWNPITRLRRKAGAVVSETLTGRITRRLRDGA